MRRWHFGAILAATALLGVRLFTVGGASAQDLLCDGVMAGSGVIGALNAPAARRVPLAFLALWAVCGAASCALSGGLAGPFAVFCLLPALAGLALGADWRDGLIFSLAAAVLAGVAGAVGVLGAPPEQAPRAWLTGGALAITCAGLAAARISGRRRADLDVRALEDRLAALSGLMSELSLLVLALTPRGGVEAAYGRADPDFPVDLLAKGLAAAVAEADRPAVEAACAAALEAGQAQASFAPALAPERRRHLIVRRAARGGLLATISGEAGGSLLFAPERGMSADVEAALMARVRNADRAKTEADEARRKAEALAAGRMQFLANMSHELRTPLNAIMGFSDMMRVRMFGELTEKYGEYAELIHESGAHLLSLINDILDISKIEAQRYNLKRQYFDVREPVNDALRLMRLQADESHVKLRGLLPTTPLLVDADKRAIKQIVLNLLSNAVKFTPAGGTVFLTAEARGADLEIVVADTGVGIASEDLDRLGQPFEQAGAVDLQVGGTGLGLSLVSALAGLHGGSLQLESRLGEGTAATVRMPVIKGAQASDSPAEPSAPVQGAPAAGLSPPSTAAAAP